MQWLIRPSAGNELASPVSIASGASVANLVTNGRTIETVRRSSTLRHCSHFDASEKQP